MATRRREGAEDPFEAIGCDEVVPIGAGGSSLVYRARQRAFDRLIAVKVLSMPLADERSRRRFERELALTGRLTGHPNVVTVFASGFFDDGRAYVEMEYCPGGSLADRLAAQGPLPVVDVVSIGVKIAGVLELARLDGIVHRDVKPANVLVTRFGEPALADFGIAIVSGEMTGTTQALTPVHAAPEVLESRGADAAADQWSLGSTLHTLLAGRAPFAGMEDEGLLAGMLRILNDPVPPIPRSDVPETLRSVLGRSLAKAPAERWPTPADLGRALQEVERREGWPVTALPVEEVFETRYSSSPEPTTGDVGPAGAGLDPRATYVVPGAPAAPVAEPAAPVRPGGIWPAPAASGPAPAAAAPAAPEGHTISWQRPADRAPEEAPTPPAPAAPGRSAPPGTSGVPAVGLVGSGPASAPPAAGLTPPGPPPPGESTQYFSRSRTELPEISSGPRLDTPSHRRRWLIAGASAAVLVVVVALVISMHGSRPSPGKTSILSAVTPPPSTNNAQSFAAVNVHVAVEQPTSVTLQWTDPNKGQLPYVVQVSYQANGAAVGNPQKTSTSTQTVVGGLTPGVGYCFAIGTLYSATGGLVYSTPKACRAGSAPPTSTTTVAPAG